MNNIRDLDLNLLKALHALIDTQSVTQTAIRLGVSQPAVSGMLVRLREAFDDPLFVRTQRGLLPTPRAVKISEPLRRMLADVDTLVQQQAFDPSSATGTLTIAATDYAQTALVLPLVHLLVKSSPGLSVAVRPVNFDFASDLASGALDIAIVTPDMAPDNLHAKKLFDEQYVCILREGHPDINQLDINRFCDLSHAIMSHDGTKFRGATDAALDELGLSRRVVATVPSFLVLIHLVRGSDTIAIVPERLTLGVEGIVVRKPPVPIAGFTKIAVWHERLHYDQANLWLRQLLANIADKQ